MLLPALEFMTIDSYDEPQIGSIKVKLTQLVQQHKDKRYLLHKAISAAMQEVRWIT